MQSVVSYRGVVSRERIALAALLTAAVAVIALAVVILAQVAATERLEERANHAATVAGETASVGIGLLLSITEAETGQRGYLLSGRPEHLQPVIQAPTKARAALTRLASASSAQSSAYQKVARIKVAVDRRLAIMANVIDLDRTGRRSEALEILNGQGLAAMQELRFLVSDLVEQMRDREHRLRDERRRIEARARTMQAGLAGVTVLALLIGLGALGMERATARRAVLAQARANAEIRAARERADEANMAKSRFLATASHDMRQPLHALALYISTLERRVESEQAREILGNMDGAVRAMTRLFTALLDLARLEAGVLTPDITDFELGEVLQEVAAQSVDPRVRPPIRVRVVPTSLRVHTDPDLLEIVLRNLTSNAVKHSKGGKVLLGCRRDGDAVRIEVHDCGRGIPAEQLDKLFSEFVRGEEAGSAEGVGLGLAIVERMSKLLGHPLGVRSEVGRGSVFSITVPLASREIEVAEGAAQAQRSLQGLSVLVADDEPLALDAMRHAFADAGARVAAAASAAEVDARAAERFDLYVFDLNLGGDSGLRLLGELEARHGAIPGLIVTGATTLEALAELRAAGRAWVNKPVTAERLISSAAALLRG